MRRPNPARVPSQSQTLGFETLESRDLLTADVGLDWWAEPTDHGSVDDWSWTFDDSWAGDQGVERSWDDGWWVDADSGNTGDAPGFDASSSESTDPVDGDTGWVADDTATAGVDAPPAEPEPPIVVAAPTDDAEATPLTQIVDPAVPPPAVVVDPVVVDTVDENDSPSTDSPITDVPPETTLVDTVDSVVDTVVDGDANDSWGSDTSPADEPADEPLPGSNAIDIGEDLPVAANGLGVDPVPVRPVTIAGSTPTFREPVSVSPSAVRSAPASRFAGWGGFFLQSFGRAGGAFDGTALGGQADGQTGSGRPRIRLPFRPVV